MLQQFELDNKIDEMKSVLNSLQNLQFTVKWYVKLLSLTLQIFICTSVLRHTHLVPLFRFEVVEQIEDAFTGLKVLAFDENCIRLSLKTYMPTFEGISYLPRIEATVDAAELNYELLIEVFEGTMRLKNVQVSK